MLDITNQRTWRIISFVIVLLTFGNFQTVFASSVTLSGILRYDGRPMSDITDISPTFWFRNEETGREINISDIISTYNNNTGAYSISGLPSIKVGISVTFHIRGVISNLPGNYNVWKIVDIPNLSRHQKVDFDIGLELKIHMTSPWDNDTLGLHTYPSGPYPEHRCRLDFAWDPVPGASRYHIDISVYWNPDHPDGYEYIGRVVNSDVYGTFFFTVLDFSNDFQHYQASIFAYDSDGNRLGHLEIAYEGARGWDYRFRVVDFSDVDGDNLPEDKGLIPVDGKGVIMYADHVVSLFRGDTTVGNFPGYYGSSFSENSPITLTEDQARAAILGPPDGHFLSLPGKDDTPSGIGFRYTLIRVDFPTPFVATGSTLLITELGASGESANVWVISSDGSFVQLRVQRNGADEIAIDLSPYAEFARSHGGVFRSVSIGGVDLLGGSQGFDLDAVAIMFIPTPIYVDDDANGSNDGSNWADAYCCLRDALAVAKGGYEIRVAQGTYKPDQQVVQTSHGTQVRSSGDRTETFQLINGVVIKGGYAGLGEPEPNARDVDVYQTVLSGDLNGDDDLSFANDAENSYHVVTGSGTNETAILDGVTITKGNANSSSPDDKGGGMQNYEGSPTVTNCKFSENSATTGGGMSNSSNSSPTVIDCTFSNNVAANNGGGMRNNSSSPTIINCKFIENMARKHGAGMNNRTGSPRVTNCTFTGNSANNYGGGMHNSHDSYPNITNCTFSWNLANSGGGMYNSNNSSPIVANCIFWGDKPQEIYTIDSTVVITNSNVQGGCPGIGNINANPLFVDADGADDEIGTKDDDLRLSLKSPCINAGDNSAISQSVVTDLDGNPRIINDIVDMGAYEFREKLPFAFNPEPANDAERVYPNVELSWLSGFGAQLHIVYFGDSFEDANIDTGGILQEITTYTPGLLEWDKVYYWRVDEFDGTVIHKGDIWNFRTIPEIDLNLVGWWRFDKGSGSIAYDSSGHGNDGNFNGNPQWVPGHSCYALEFDGSGDWLDCGVDPSLRITNAVTVAAWIKVGAQGIDHKICGNQDGINGGYKMTVYSNNRVEFEIRTANNRAILNRDIGGGTILQRDVWYHVTGVYSLEDSYIRTYVNGLLDREKNTTEALGDSLGPFRIGCEPFETGFQQHHFNGVMDDIRIYNRALTEGEVLWIIEEGDEVWSYAFNPKPADGAINPNTWVRLSWSPGGTAVSHNVYFGDNFEDVEADTEDTFQGNQTATYFDVGSARRPYLVPGVTYYWRIDEVEIDGITIHKGDVWSFSIPP